MEERVFAIAHYVDLGVLYLLVILSLVSVAMIIERFVRLAKQAKRSKKFLASVEERLASQSGGDELRLDELPADPRSVEGRALSLGLGHLRRSGTKGLEEVFNAVTMLERPKLERYLNFLATVGSNAPYIGLFGTVLGIMKAFREMAGASEAGQQAVMAGISGALIATAAGLMVAIPSVIAFNFFQKQVKVILQGIDACRELCLSYGKQRGL